MGPIGWVVLATGAIGAVAFMRHKIGRELDQGQPTLG